ncbi:peptidase [Mesorhizobium waimense]|uniref:Peptidase n=1 Tax=Mesorhizobium waimense TaxID=1300307 RepID=A0A3A5KVP3_9HYPH|nr:membrane dipeptidase [Mesorhizobium waimense]RJT40654.1 peptidase [Mesorhizobium waimense]
MSLSQAVAGSRCRLRRLRGAGAALAQPVRDEPNRRTGLHDRTPSRRVALPVCLTSFGAAVVDEMNRIGMFVDVSHCSYRTSMDVMQRSSQPVIFSHSNPRALVNHQRNITDDQIRACAATGGLVGVVGLENFLGDASPETLSDHICYLSDLIGPKHVGISLDHSFPVDVPEANEMYQRFPQYWLASQGYLKPNRSQMHPSDLKKVASILIGRGMSDRDVNAIFGGNFLRLAAHIWR